MADRPDITLDDLKTLAKGQAPDLAQAIIHFANQPQPAPENVPEGALTPESFEQQLAAAQKEYRESVKRMKVALLWRRYLTYNPRFVLGFARQYARHRRSLPR